MQYIDTIVALNQAVDISRIVRANAGGVKLVILRGAGYGFPRSAEHSLFASHEQDMW